jgi:hypothetical protein
VLLFGGHLQSQKVYGLLFGLLLNKLRNQHLGFRERMNISQENDLVLPECGLNKLKGWDSDAGGWPGGGQPAGSIGERCEQAVNQEES